MEYIEAPSIQEISHKLVFPRIKWLSKEKFQEYINKGKQIYPFIKNRDNSSLSNCYFIGKTIQHNLDEGVRYNQYYQYYDHDDYRPQSGNREGNVFSLEIIGTVFKNTETDEWQLNVPHGSNCVEVKKNFLILSIEDPNCFEWKKTSKAKIPRNALRGCIDRVCNEFFYIGKTSFESENPSYYQNEWKPYEQPSKVPKLFGKVHPSHSVMYVAFDNLELAYDTYDTLCLKPSPNKLKNLCRLELRKLLAHSNEKIEKINQNGLFFLPDSLVNFVKYPNFLVVGEYMLKGEKVVRKDGKFELVIENDNTLVCKSIILNKEKLSKEELVEAENTQIKRIIASNVHSLWLTRFQVALYKADSRVRVIHNFFDKSPEYAITIDDSSEPNIRVVEIKDL